MSTKDTTEWYAKRHPDCQICIRLLHCQDDVLKTSVKDVICIEPPNKLVEGHLIFAFDRHESLKSPYVANALVNAAVLYGIYGRQAYRLTLESSPQHAMLHYLPLKKKDDIS